MTKPRVEQLEEICLFLGAGEAPLHTPQLGEGGGREVGSSLPGTGHGGRVKAGIFGVHVVVESALPGSLDSQPWRSNSLRTAGLQSGRPVPTVRR